MAKACAARVLLVLYCVIIVLHTYTLLLSLSVSSPTLSGIINKIAEKDKKGQESGNNNNHEEEEEERKKDKKERKKKLVKLVTRFWRDPDHT